MFEYLIHFVSEGHHGHYRTKLANPISSADIEVIQGELSEEKIVKPVVLGFYLLATGPDQDGGNDPLFMVKDITTGQLVEFHIRQEAVNYYNALVSLYGDLHEIEMVARLANHKPPEVLS